MNWVEVNGKLYKQARPLMPPSRPVKEQLRRLGFYGDVVPYEWQLVSNFETLIDINTHGNRQVGDLPDIDPDSSNFRAAMQYLEDNYYGEIEFINPVIDIGTDSNYETSSDEPYDSSLSDEGSDEIVIDINSSYEDNNDGDDGIIMTDPLVGRDNKNDDTCALTIPLLITLLFMIIFVSLIKN